MGKKTVKIYSLKGFISFMDNFLNKLERKFGRYAIPDLIRYVIILYCAGAVIGMINENIYYEYLCLDMSAVFRGQIWRLVTFLIEPYGFQAVWECYSVFCFCNSGSIVLFVWTFT